MRLDEEEDAIARRMPRFQIRFLLLCVGSRANELSKGCVEGRRRGEGEYLTWEGMTIKCLNLEKDSYQLGLFWHSARKAGFY